VCGPPTLDGILETSIEPKKGLVCLFQFFSISFLPIAGARFDHGQFPNEGDPEILTLDLDPRKNWFFLWFGCSLIFPFTEFFTTSVGRKRSF